MWSIYSLPMQSNSPWCCTSVNIKQHCNIKAMSKKTENNNQLTLRRHDTDGRMIFAAFHMKQHFPRWAHLLHLKFLHFHAPFGEVTSIRIKKYTRKRRGESKVTPHKISFFIQISRPTWPGLEDTKSTYIKEPTYIKEYQNTYSMLWLK